MKSTVCAACLVLLGFSTTTVAQDADDWKQWPMGHRFTIHLGAYVPQLDTQLSVDRTDGLAGTTLNFEQNLGMRDTAILPTFAFAWRFARKHKFGVSYFELNRSGSEVTETEIRIGDKVFNVNLPVASFFDVDVLSANYHYSVINKPKAELSLSVGLSVQDMTFGTQANQGGNIILETSDLTAPLPTVGLSGGYAFTDKWIFRGSVGVFAISLDWEDADNFGGTIVDVNAALFYQAFRHFRFGLAYAYFDVDVDWTKRDKFTAINYDYHGPMFVFGTTF